MKTKQMNMSWIVVSDIKKARTFFEKVVGLKVGQVSEEHGWVEMSGHEGGCHLGIAQANDRESVKPGENAIVTFTVENIDEAKASMTKHGVKFLGDIIHIPNHVKMQFFVDADGNKFQIVELFDMNK